MFHLSSFCMLQLLHMDVSKVDRLLHIRCAWEAIGDVGPLLGHSLASPTRWGTCSLAERYRLKLAPQIGRRALTSPDRKRRVIQINF